MLGSIVSMLKAPSAIKLADKIIIFNLLILDVKLVNRKLLELNNNFNCFNYSRVI